MKSFLTISHLLYQWNYRWEVQWRSKRSDTVTIQCASAMFTQEPRVCLNTGTKHTRPSSCTALADGNINWPKQYVPLTALRETQVRRLKPNKRPSHHLSECHLFANWSWMAASSIHMGGWDFDACQPILLEKAQELSKPPSTPTVNCLWSTTWQTRSQRFTQIKLSSEVNSMALAHIYQVLKSNERIGMTQNRQRMQPHSHLKKNK